MTDDNVVKLNTPKPQRKNTKFTYCCGPQTILPDITPYESAVLMLLIVRTSAPAPVYLEDLMEYDACVLRHIHIQNSEDKFVRGDIILTNYKAAGSVLN